MSDLAEAHRHPVYFAECWGAVARERMYQQQSVDEVYQAARTAFRFAILALAHV